MEWLRTLEILLLILCLCGHKGPPFHTKVCQEVEGLGYKLSDVEAIKAEVPGLKYVSPRNRLGGYQGANNVTYGTKTGAFQVDADYPEYIFQDPSLDILQGRFINYSDINSKRKVCHR